MFDFLSQSPRMTRKQLICEFPQSPTSLSDTKFKPQSIENKSFRYLSSLLLPLPPASYFFGSSTIKSYVSQRKVNGTQKKLGTRLGQAEENKRMGLSGVSIMLSQQTVCVCVCVNTYIYIYIYKISRYFIIPTYRKYRK